MNLKHLIIALGAIVFLGACDDGESENALLEIRLTDSPGDYQEVNVEVIDVRIKRSDDDGEDGWESLNNVNTGVYNLLDLTNGKDTLLASDDLPAGRISQIRLILGDDNTLKINDDIVSLTTPSAQQSGLKLKINAELVEGIGYRILLDFDAARSVVKAGNSGKFNLKPVIRTITEAIDGAIKGKTVPAQESVAVFAIIDSDTLGTSFTNAGGEFSILGLDAGIYTVSLDPGEEFEDIMIESVTVNLGEFTDLGDLELTPTP